MKPVVAIDQGTTGTTVLVLDEQAQVRGRGYREFTQYFPRPGWVEHDPDEIWRVTSDVIEQALQDAGVRAGDVAAVGITNQRETTVLWDRRTGEPVHRAIVWQDRRTKQLCDRLTADGLGATVREKTGLVIDPYFSGTKIAWMLDHVEGLRAARRARRARVRHHRFLAPAQAHRWPAAHHRRHQCLPHPAARHRKGRLGRGVAEGATRAE